MDLIDDPAPGQNAPEFSISELSGAIKRVIEGEFAHVRVRGEVGRVSRPRSGHVYLDLKDDRAVLAGVIWKGVTTRLATQPEEGLEVVATGRLTTFPGQSRYQIVIDDIRPAGVGALMAMLEKRKKALAAEGLFDDARKRPLPYLPEVIGVVTSPSGAVIRDILHRLRDRFPRKVLVWPAAVQGDACAPQVAAAIEGFNRMTPGGGLPRPDVLIVARGGGSIEDLWGFNEETVARAAAASEIPLISAVGHETDTTLIDFVSDRRAPTPTAAAEMAVPVRADLLAWLDAQGARLTRRLADTLAGRGQRLRDLTRALPRPEALLTGPRQRLDLADTRLHQGLRQLTHIKRAQYTENAALLSPRLLGARLSGRREALAARAARLGPSLERDVRDKRARLDGAVTALDRGFGARMRSGAEARARAHDLWIRACAAVARRKRSEADRLMALDRLRVSLGYHQTLARGYAVVRDGSAVITTAKAAREASALEIEFHDGRVRPGAAARSTRSGSKTPHDGQGSLF
ncbi:MAG: exodeoxyribonuclease VII large subunit [Pseudomonadota bacterium]